MLWVGERCASSTWLRTNDADRELNAEAKRRLAVQN